ncbi:MAG: ORF6N domain-containing protein [Coriobacteriia bacterium]|nr:ORF6N domain-containing protein [Coriobacteriia bacterium]
MSDQMVPTETILASIHVIRGQRVLLDTDLAVLYGVETKRLLQAVTRNSGRFPEDFMFRLTLEEFDSLRDAQRSESAWGGRRYPPYAFTEQGVAMLSSVLRSERAVAVNIGIMRAFVRLREMLRSNKELALRLDDLEAKYDSQFAVVFDAIRQLMTPPMTPRNPVGFTAPEDSSG